LSALQLEVNARGSRALVEGLRASVGELAELAPTLPAARRAERRAHERRVDAAGEPEPSSPRRKRARVVDGVTMRGSSRLLDWSPDDFARARRIEGSMREARGALVRLPRCYSQRVERAALAMLPRTDGTRRPTRTLAHIAARRIVALAVVLYHAGRTSRRRGMARIVVGRTRRMFGTLFRRGVDRAPLSVSAIFATSHHDKRDPWDCGPMVALHRAGALWRRQPPAAAAGAHVGRDRHGVPRAFNEYHLTQRALSAVADEAPRELIDWPHELVALDGATPGATPDQPP